MKPRRKRQIPDKSPSGKRSGSTPSVTLRCLQDGTGWEFVHPRCALERAEDLAEVRRMVDVGETEIARDELRWLLDGCSDLIEAHKLLGELALLEEDHALARGHFGYAYRIGEQTLRSADVHGPLPYAAAPNQPFFEAAKGLAYCLLKLGKRDLAEEVAAKAILCDPSDPLGMRQLLAVER